ncbi:patatin-like phospholipase family protein [Candidatus Woesearchaeota archaeon]|nr:patatin-like phospholipase family protein [Candidatus Woesearchaeota archaeon]MBT6519919.1 patatin-like phospholipase family protein [Candidatus Woesearchaeota archaeon]MBT7367105.1 patatin-like phospholipase family protein [Candidatus Woesearchaeota archaeon]
MIETYTNSDLEKIIISGKRRNAMVASGGGLKAHFFHMGVGMRLEEVGFKFSGGVLSRSKTDLLLPGPEGNNKIDMYVCSSGGALFGIGVAMGYSPEEMRDLFMNDWLLRKSGLRRGVLHYASLNTQAITQALKSAKKILKKRINPESLAIMSPIHLGPLEKKLHKFLDTEDFTKVASDLFIVTTPLNQTKRIVYCRKDHQENGRIIYRNDANISSTVAGSCSLQFFYPFCIEHKNGEKIDVVDGETRKTLSYKIASDNGADLVFVSYTHVPYQFKPEIGSIKKFGLIKTVIQSVYLLIEEKILASRKANNEKNYVHDRVQDEYEKLIKKMPQFEDFLVSSRESLVGDLVSNLDIKRNVDYVFIHPDPNDEDFFLEWHMGMSKSYIERMVKKGYESADKALEKYEFRFG